MKVPHRQASTQYIAVFLGLCFFISGTSFEELSAQTTETGSTTIDTNAGAGTDLPLNPEQEPNRSNKKKKDERPRELGVMVLILWLLAGTGIGILIFTSLFGHSVRSMVRRPYPQQTQPEQQPPLEMTTEDQDPSAQRNEKPPNS